MKNIFSTRGFSLDGRLVLRCKLFDAGSKAFFPQLEPHLIDIDDYAVPHLGERVTPVMRHAMMLIPSA